MNDENLVKFTPENARERQLKSAQKRKENHAKKVLMSQIYAEFLEKKYDVKVGDGKKKKITGAELVNECMKKIIARGDSASVSLMAELRKALEGENLKISGDITAKFETQEERLKAFEDLMK